MDAGPKPRVTTKLERMTPKRAHKYLALFGKNRKISPGWVTYLANEIKAKRWLVTNSGIGFNKKGEGDDGQHRLKAVIEANCDVWMNVTRGLDKGTKNVIDINRIRKPQDVLMINGIDLGPGAGAVIKQLRYGGQPATQRVPHTELLDWARKASDGVRFVNAAFNKKAIRSITVAPVVAVLIRAYYARPNDHERIQRFAQVLALGHGARGDEQTRASFCTEFDAALKLKEFLEKAKASDTWMLTGDRHYKTEKMLQCYLDGIPTPKVIGPRKELFPLPWDDGVSVKSVQER